MSTLSALKTVGISPAIFYDWKNNIQLNQGIFVRRKKPSKLDSDKIKNAIFKLLHEPPTLHAINRTSWRLEDLREVLYQDDIQISPASISKIIKKAGFRYTMAKTILTSHDPKYREKLNRVKKILSKLKNDEKFFSIDEYGPFAIKIKGGRKLTLKNQIRTVPQKQKSKGYLIVTAALELSTNQLTHFYSKGKNSAEMIRLVEMLVEQYSSQKKLYLSWDAATWHYSKMLTNKIKELNRFKSGPKIYIVPLPSNAQFLNVIESVFGGMGRAIIHNSDYGSVGECMCAIDKYFAKRNQHFKDDPKRAGSKIWGGELVKSEFSALNNCKDPNWR